MSPRCGRPCGRPLVAGGLGGEGELEKDRRLPQQCHKSGVIGAFSDRRAAQNDGMQATVREEDDMADPQGWQDGLTGEPLLLTPEEAAQVLRVGRTTLYALIKDGDLRPIHIGRSCRLSRAELERYVDRLEALAPAPSSRLDRRRRNTPRVRGYMSRGDETDAS